MSGVLLSQAAFARSIGKSRQWVNHLVKTGVITLEGKKINPTTAMAAIENAKDPTRDAQREANEKKKGGTLFDEEVIPEKSLATMSKAEKKEYAAKQKKEAEELEAIKKELEANGAKTDIDVKDLSLNGVKAFKELFLGKLAELNYNKQSDELVPKEVVAQDAFEMGRLIRDNLLNIPHKLSVRITGIKDPKEVERMIQVEIDQVLEQLSQ